MSGEYNLTCIYAFHLNAKNCSFAEYYKPLLIRLCLIFILGKRARWLILFSWKKQEFTSFGSLTNLFCIIAHDHLHVCLYSCLFCQFSAIPTNINLLQHFVNSQYNLIACQFIQISVCTVITTKGDDIRESDRNVNKRIYEEWECEY